MAWKWFSVKGLYRVTTQGRPRHPDAHYDARSTLVEERIVLLRARSFEEALRKAKVERGRYLEDMAHYRNVYGQKVRWRFLGVAEAFELFDSPGHAREVFSQTYVADRATSDAALIRGQFGPNEKNRRRRAKFTM